MASWIGLVIILAVLLWEARRLGQARGSVAVRIHVHGTRGKSATVRQLASLLRSRGHTVLAKTTGDAPEYILPNGTIEPIVRRAPPRIHEHLTALLRAERLNADVLVVEGMALQPETIQRSQDILLATHTVVCNLRADHAETMGEGRIGVLRALRLLLPPGGRVYTAEEAGARALSKAARSVGASCTIVPAPLMNQAPALAAAVALDLMPGPSQIHCCSGFSSAGQAGDEEPSQNSTRDFTFGGVRVRFHDFFSANDVASSKLLLKSVPATAQTGSLRAAVLATRSDRPLRTVAFVDWLCAECGFDRIVFVGDHAACARLRALRRGWRFGDERMRAELPWTRAEQTLLRLTELARSAQAHTLEIVALGNAHGAGQQWRALIAGLD